MPLFGAVNGPTSSASSITAGAGFSAGQSPGTATMPSVGISGRLDRISATIRIMIETTTSAKVTARIISRVSTLPHALQDLVQKAEEHGLHRVLVTGIDRKQGHVVVQLELGAQVPQTLNVIGAHLVPGDNEWNV